MRFLLTTLYTKTTYRPLPAPLDPASTGPVILSANNPFEQSRVETTAIELNEKKIKLLENRWHGNRRYNTQQWNTSDCSSQKRYR